MIGISTVRLLDADERSTLFRNREALVITNRREFAAALGKAVGVGITALLPDASLHLADLLEQLAAAPDLANAAAIVIDPAIRVRELGSPPAGSGLELLKHIRLSVTVGAARCRPIGVGVLGSVDAAIRSRPDNVLAIAPGSYPLSVPFSYERVCRFFAEAEELRDIRQIQEFVVYGGDDTASSVHDYRNKAGLATFLSEFAGDVLPADHPVLVENNRRRATSLWLKKREFLERAGTSTSGEEPVRTEALRALCRDKQFLLVDDEHDAGWCTALYAGLFGKEPPREHQNLLPRFRCLGTEAEAMTFLDDVEREWKNWVKRWSAADQERGQSVRSADAAQSDERALARKVKVAEERTVEVKGLCDKKSAYTATTRQGYLAKLNEAAVHFAELFTSDAQIQPEDIMISNLVAELDSSRRVFEDALNSERKEAAALEAALADLETQKAQLEEVAGRSRGLIDERNLAERNFRAVAAERRAILPVDLAFVDMRLDPAETSTDDGSGSRILRRIHELEPTFPVIVFSASNAIGSYQASARSGVRAYWIKGMSTATMAGNLIQSALSHDDVRKCWLASECLENKRQVGRIRIVRGAATLDAMPHAHREVVLARLRQSLHELQQPEPDLSAIIRDLGIVQEVRYVDLYGDKWQALEAKLPDLDRQLRQLRNKVSHPKEVVSLDSGVVVDLLRYTFDWLLDDRAVALATKLARK